MAYRLLESGVGPCWSNGRCDGRLAAASLVVGTCSRGAANLKRMLAYPPCPTSASCFMGLAGGGEPATPPACSMRSVRDHALGSWAIIVLMSQQGFEADRIDDYKGLNPAARGWRPWCLHHASLAGVPPFLGFWAKLAVLRAALEGGLMWLAIVGIVAAVVGRVLLPARDQVMF